MILLATDTADGRCCAEELARVIASELGIARVQIERIEGLQVRDAVLLRQTGLANLTRRLIHYLDDPQRRYGGGCVLCPNGGFKGVVPFMTVLGMIYRAPVVYVFEFAETVISLPPLPIGFATDLFARALPALAWAAQAGVFDIKDFQSRIPQFAVEEAVWFDSFLELASGSEDGVLASLSPLAMVLAERESVGASLQLSPRAQRELQALSGPERREVESHLRKLSSPLWRSQHRDSKYCNDLEFYPRGHNPWRFAGFSHADGFHLCWFARHDDYERRLPQRESQRAAFAGDTFVEYVAPPAEANAGLGESAVPEADRELSWLELHDQLLQLRQEQADLAEAQRELASVAEERRKQLQVQQRQLEQRNTQLKQLTEELYTLQQAHRQLEAALRPPVPAVPAGDLPADWLGQTVLASYCGRKKKSLCFEFHDGQTTHLVLVASREVVAEPSWGTEVPVRIYGRTGDHYQAHMVLAEPGH